MTKKTFSIHFQVNKLALICYPLLLYWVTSLNQHCLFKHVTQSTSFFLSPIMSYFCVCMQSRSPPTCTHWVSKECMHYKGELPVRPNWKFSVKHNWTQWVIFKMVSSYLNYLCYHLKLMCMETNKAHGWHWYRWCLNIKKLKLGRNLWFELDSLLPTWVGVTCCPCTPST